MKKKSILIIIVILFISLLLYIAGNIKYSDKNNFQDRWNVKIPKNSTVKEIYSDVGFHGEGYRIIKLQTSQKNVEDTTFKRGNDINIENRYSNFVSKLLEKSKLKIQEDKLEFVGIQEKKSEGGMLVITYNDMDKCYYLFENIY